MKQAIWNGEVIAQSDNTVNIEGNHYFPDQSLNKSFIEDSQTETNCHWKGIASYYTLNVNGKKNPDAVWFYSNPKDAAKVIKNRVAFWKGVEIKDI